MQELLEQLAQLMKAQGLTLATAESCTGGWLAKACTDLPGSSHWFDTGVVSYSNEAKRRLLGVSTEIQMKYGAVSEQCTSQMVKGLLERHPVGIGVAISGIAGPDGGSDEKPVGTVCFSWKKRGHEVISRTMYFPGDRNSVRKDSVTHAIKGVLEVITTSEKH